MLDAGLEAIKVSTGQVLQSQLTTLGFHIKPGNKPYREIMAQFVNAKALGGEGALAYGVSVYMNDYFFVVDNSAGGFGWCFCKIR